MADEQTVHFGPYRLDAANVRLWQETQPVRLTPKAFQVLCYLADRPGQLVSKDELFAAVWVDTVVSDATLTSAIQEIRKALQDDARAPQYVATVPKRGFRFIGEVVRSQQEENQKAKGKNQKAKMEETEIEKADTTLLNGDGLRTAEHLADETLLVPPSGEGLSAEPSPLPITVTPRRFRPWRILLLLVVLLLGGVLIAKWRLVRLVLASYTSSPVADPVALPLPDKQSLVVLPLVNLSSDSNQEYFSDGLTDDLINTLAQFPDLFVIARHSAFTYKGKTIKEQDIAKDLGVRYVLAGSVRRAGEQVRMNVQLVDATTGEQVWAHRYDRPFTEIFALQDDLVQKLATTLKLQLSAWTYGFSVRKTTDNVEAYDYVLRGLHQWIRLTKRENLQAREFFDTALTLDPRYAQACALIGFTYLAEWTMHWSRDPQILERTLEYGQKAIALNDFDALSHMILALGYVQKGQIDRALSEVERVITLQPNLAESYHVQAEVLMYAGRPAEALQSSQQAIRLSPRGPFIYFATLGWAYNFTAQYAESNAASKRALALNPFFPPAYMAQAFNYTSQWMTQRSLDPKILDQAYDAAQNAVTLNADSFAHTVLGTVYLWQKHYDAAITEFERAATFAGITVCNQMQVAGGLSLVGRVEEAVRVGERALSLKALPSDDSCLFWVATVYWLAGRLEEAAVLLQRQLQRFPHSLMSHLWLADIYSQLGRETEARAAAAEVLRINPQFSLEVHKQRVPLKDPVMLERHIAALRKAGLK